LRRHYPKVLLYPIAALLFVANAINIGADLSAMGDALKLLVGGSSAKTARSDTAKPVARRPFSASLPMTHTARPYQASVLRDSARVRAPRSVDDRDVMFVYRGGGERVREATK
jgi:hypothetical protein